MYATALYIVWCDFARLNSFHCAVLGVFMLSYGAIAGIVLGALAFIILILYCIAICCCCCYAWFLRKAASRKRRGDVRFVSKDPYHDQAVLIEGDKPKVYVTSATSH